MTIRTLISLSSLSKESAEIVQKYPQQFEQILMDMDYKSKKKRHRKKVSKLAVVRLLKEVESNSTETKVAPTPKAVVSNVVPMPTIVQPVAQVTEVAPKVEKTVVVKQVTDVTDTFDFKKLPVGFMLKVGKKFFADEKVFRYYYNQKHPEFYKAKDVLQSQFENLVKEADGSLKEDIMPLIKDQLSS